MISNTHAIHAYNIVFLFCDVYFLCNVIPEVFLWYYTIQHWLLEAWLKTKNVAGYYTMWEAWI